MFGVADCTLGVLPFILRNSCMAWNRYARGALDGLVVSLCTLGGAWLSRCCTRQSALVSSIYCVGLFNRGDRRSCSMTRWLSVCMRELRLVDWTG